jgi:hypothetical protein
MPHTQSRYMQDLGFTDGKVFCGPGDIVWDVAAQAGVSRVAAGQWGVAHVAGANTTNFAVNLTQAILRRLGFFEDIQEQFGPANPSAPAATAIAGSAQVRNYRPDVIGAMNTAQQLQPRTAFKTKGFRLISFDVIYTIATIALTTHTCRVDQTVYANNVAAATTSILASAANGLQVATQANPYVTTVTPAVQPYTILNDTALWIEVQAVAQATTAYTLVGIDALVEFNLN